MRINIICEENTAQICFKENLFFCDEVPKSLFYKISDNMVKCYKNKMQILQYWR